MKDIKSKNVGDAHKGRHSVELTWDGSSVSILMSHVASVEVGNIDGIGILRHSAILEIGVTIQFCEVLNLLLRVVKSGAGGS